MNPRTPQNSYATPELLAPAGSFDALRAAVNNGADAVYLGVGDLNARRGAQNFTDDELLEATRYAHIRGVRVYLTANVVVRPAEMPAALELVDMTWAAGVDAVIVQDLGLARVLREALPHVRLHASTQIGAHDSATVAELDRIGFSRVTLAREVALEQVAALARASGPEIEVFAHGALCVCYSGQCLLSSAVGGRSANRGSCAQPCRLPYELLDDKGKKLETPGRYLLSPRDLCTIDMVPHIIAAGVAAVKIEGRMKSPEYVAVVTRTYRAALDRAFVDPDGFSVSDAEHAALAEVFSRGFTSGHLVGERGEDLMAYSRPNNRGVPVGRVATAGGGRVVIALERALDIGDVLEFWTGRGRFAHAVTELTVDGHARTSVPAGEKAEVAVGQAVTGGDRVFRVVSASLEAAARRTFAATDAGRSIKTDIAVKVRIGEPLAVIIEGSGMRGEAAGPVVEAARTKPLTVTDIMEHVGRLGGTPFVADSWDIELDPTAGAGFSTLHKVRRDAVAALESALLAEWSDRVVVEPSLPLPRATSAASRLAPEMPELVVWTTRIAVARACLGAGAHRAIIPHWALTDDVELPERVSMELSRVAHEPEFDDVLAWARTGETPVAGTLGMLSASASRGAAAWAHWGLNAVNPWTVVELADAGASGAWLSPEVSGREVRRIAEESGVPVGISVLGRQEVMVLEHCVISAAGRCSRACATCPRRERWYALKDRKGYGMPVIVDRAGRSHIFNAVPLDLTRALDEVVSTGVAAVRMDFSVEHIQQAQQITKHVRAALEAVVAGRGPRTEPVVEPATAGHFFRGVG